MQVSFQLTHLDISNNAIGDAGCIALMHSVERAQCMYELHLEANNIGAPAAPAISQAVTRSNLRALFLDNNRLGTDGGSMIFASVSMYYVFDSCIFKGVLTLQISS